ncbi:hypothetical protein [Nocardiopsis sp. LOL_012]|uniref:hypothetical protein n=1 Tax=Nocardiopsis sp. LOL_012 TaxID=3345409 RepID=UPI003A8A865D
MHYGPGQPPEGTGGYQSPPGAGGGYPPPPGGMGGPPPPPPPIGGGPPPGSGGIQGAAIGAIVANAIGLCLCWMFSIVGLVLGIVSASIAGSNPQAARTCMVISYAMFGVGIVAWVVYLVFYGGSVIWSMNESSYY